ncbi:MAG: hypothetical protein DWQ02_21775 [Bacteroidetes bacterium]|nr:MAG: hypothetical protein DWQ02_21775 [Bacteroidota bacterium]
MAVLALGKVNRFRVPAFVAAFTINTNVFSFQVIIRQGMIEEVHRFHFDETAFLVTLGAVTTEFSFMEIVMAFITFIFIDPLLVLEDPGRIPIGFMATITVLRTVFSF